MKVLWSEFAAEELKAILVTDIFDTRQNPTKINNPERKSSLF